MLYGTVAFSLVFAKRHGMFQAITLCDEWLAADPAKAVADIAKLLSALAGDGEEVEFVDDSFHGVFGWQSQRMPIKGSPNSSTVVSSSKPYRFKTPGRKGLLICQMQMDR